MGKRVNISTTASKAEKPLKGGEGGKEKGPKKKKEGWKSTASKKKKKKE